MGVVTLRPATVDDVPLLHEWDTRPHVIASSGDDDVRDWADEIAHADAWTEHLIAEEEGRPIGVLEIIDPALESTHYWGDAEPGQRAIDIWIGEVPDLDRGLGSQMMALALARCFDDHAVWAVLIDPLESNTAARRFYERQGFEVVGPRRFGSDDCIVYRMTRSRWTEVTAGR